jgi:hypothetical protein
VRSSDEVRIRTIGAGIVRIGCGAVVLIFLAWNFGNREQLWGPSGLIPWSTYHKICGLGPFCLYAISRHPAYAEVLYWLAVALAACMVAGIWPTLLLPAFLCVFRSLLAREPFAIDGGLKLLADVTLLICFADCGRLAVLRSPGICSTWKTRLGLETFRTILHNAAMFAIAFQVCTVYYWSLFYKMSGSSWQHGNALFYAVTNERFATPLGAALSHHVLAVVVGTYATLLLQMAMVVVMWSRRLKVYLLLVVIAFHVSIAVVMNLWLFSLAMIVVDVSLLSNADFSNLGRVFASLRRRLLRPQRPGLCPAGRTVLDGPAAKQG